MSHGEIVRRYAPDVLFRNTKKSGAGGVCLHSRCGGDSVILCGGRCAVRVFFKTAIVISALTLGGCGGLPYLQIRGQLSSLEGQPLSAATTKLGAPTEEKTLSGRKVYEWKKQWQLDEDGDDQECVIRAFMKGDVIGELHFTGDENQCYRFAKTLEK